MDIRDSLKVLWAGIAAVVIVALVMGLYFGGAFSGKSSTSSNTAPTGTLPKAATEKPTIATGTNAATKVKGYKLTVRILSVPEIARGQWAVEIAVQGGANRSQTLATERLALDKPFIISNNQAGSYTITPTILNCGASKDCTASSKGYTLPSISSIPPKRNAVVIITAKCIKSKLAAGIDCAGSQIQASYR